MFDDGRQRITFDEHNGVVHIVKPFRVDKEDRYSQLQTIQSLTLYASVHPKKQVVKWIENTVLPSLQMEHLKMAGVMCALVLAYFMVR